MTKCVRLIKDRVAIINGCWIWQAAKTGSGYGALREGKYTRSAHIISYESFVGKIPEGLQLDHLCRNRACVNPSHLEPVTPGENVRRGLLTKLTIKQVNDIKKMYALGMRQHIIANKFKVHQSLISNIVNGKRRIAQ